jgi:DASH complex subunit DAM1
MSSGTPQAGGSIKRSTSGSRRPLSRPTTPLRPSSRSSLRESGKGSFGGASDAPLEAFEPAFAELSDSMADLEANFMHLQLMHESLARFSENFASFLYGLNMNAFCVDFPEVRGVGGVLLSISDTGAGANSGFIQEGEAAGGEARYALTKNIWLTRAHIYQVKQPARRSFTGMWTWRQHSCRPGWIL